MRPGQVGAQQAAPLPSQIGSGAGTACTCPYEFKRNANVARLKAAATN